MHHLPPSRRPSRSTFGEALIVVSVTAGFFYLFSRNNLSPQDITWGPVGFLIAIVLFYFALLFCRMLFFWMTGGEASPYPWWMHQAEWGKTEDRKTTQE